MYIISDFHDYYDSAIGFGGIDKSVVYERKSKIIEYDNGYYSKNRGYFWNILDASHPRGYRFHGYLNGCINTDKTFRNEVIRHHIIGFCGKTYCMFKHEYQKKDELIKTEDYYYGEEILEVIARRIISNKYYETKGEVEKNYNELLTMFHNKEHMELFLQHKIPCFVEHLKNNLILNPNLSDVKFFKMFDSFRAFQEIEMFISGVLGVNERPTVEISDKYRILSHGFDLKTSFRKPSSGK